MRLGQVVQLFDAAAQADAEHLAAAEGDQRVRQLVGLAERVASRSTGPGRRRCARAATATARSSARTRSSSTARDQPKNMRALTPPRNRMPIAITTITMKAPMSGSSSSSRPTTADRHGHRQKALGRTCACIPACAPCSRRRKQHGELHQFRRLQFMMPSEIQRRAPLTPLPMCGISTSDQQHQRADEQPGRGLLPGRRCGRGTRTGRPPASTQMNMAWRIRK